MATATGEFGVRAGAMTMHDDLPRVAARRLFEYAAGTRTITPRVAWRMLQVNAGLPPLLPPHAYVPLPPPEQAMLAALAEGTPRALIAAKLECSAQAVEHGLRHAAAVLASDLLLWRDDDGGAGEREPRRPSPGGLSSHAARPLPLSSARVLAAVQALLEQDADLDR